MEGKTWIVRFQQTTRISPNRFHQTTKHKQTKKALIRDL